jgi:hypothetical protein
MNDDYIRYAQGRKHENLSAIGRYIEKENYALIDKYVTQKQHFGMGEMLGYILAQSLVKSFEEILKEIFD